MNKVKPTILIKNIFVFLNLSFKFNISPSLYDINIGECVAIINCEPSLTKSSIKHNKDNCLLGDKAASGSSNIYNPFPVNLF